MDYIGNDGNGGWSEAWVPMLPGQSLTDPLMALDPICHRLVPKRQAEIILAAPINGTEIRTLYFCTSQCRAAFEHDPQCYGYQR